MIWKESERPSKAEILVVSLIVAAVPAATCYAMLFALPRAHLPEWLAIITAMGVSVFCANRLITNTLLGPIMKRRPWYQQRERALAARRVNRTL